MWRRGRELGRGAFSSVYLATRSHDQAYSVQAVKTSPVSKSKTLSRERKLLKRFEGCPSIIRSFGSDITTENGDNLYNLFLEYASGGTLFDNIKSGELPENDAKRYAKSILTGLDYIHKKGYSHCDIKPENILLVEQETSVLGLNRKRKRGCEFTAKISDFGLAKKTGKETEKDIRGTPMYLAPESFLHNNYEPKVDIWALGCVVLQMLTGTTPWDKKLEPVAILFKIGFTKQLPEVPDWVSEEARDFLERCLVRDPESRWSAEMLLKHSFVSLIVNESTTITKIEENKEVAGKDHEETDEYLSILIKPYFALSDEAKRKRMKMSADGIDVEVNWLGVQCVVKGNTMIPSVDTRIEIFD